MSRAVGEADSRGGHPSVTTRVPRDGTLQNQVRSSVVIMVVKGGGDGG